MREKLCRIGTVVTGGLFLLYWVLDPTFSEDALTQRLLKSLISRMLGSAVFFCLLGYLRYRIWNKPRIGCLLILIPTFLVVVNNLPILALINREAQIDRWDLVALFALDSLLIGIFEELAFRGTLFLAILERHRSSTKQIFWVTVISSAAFGLIHFVNMAEGQGIVPTLMQVGYSFLIGAMCSIVLLKTGNIVFCILLHGVYDFCGMLLPTLGSGSWWDTPTVIFTAILAVAVSLFMLAVLCHITPDETDRLYESQS